ncbi:MAG: Bcr/CflA family efflux MFS transporter [Legionellales bacterium]|nr:Bcr/CflA family efflux MFS transporter [Legionellales bacterium]
MLYARPTFVLVPMVVMAQAVSSIFMVVMLLCVIMVAVVDLFIPSLPAMTIQLNTSTDWIQWTISLYVLGYSLSHFFYGPLSDRFGRRPILLTGLAITLLGSTVCVLASTIEWLLLGRILQGLGFGAGGLLSRAILRDTYTDATLARYSSYCGIVISITIGIAPVVGGVLEEWLSWRASFITLLALVLFVFVYTYFKLPETNSTLNVHALRWASVMSNYRILLTHKIFWGYTLCASLAFSGIIAYITTIPFLMINIIGLSPAQFGLLAILIAAAQTIGFTLNARFIEQLGIQAAIQIGFGLMFLGSILLLVVSLSGWLTVWSIMLPVTLYVIGTGLIYSNTFAGAFTPFPDIVGSVSALYGGLQFAIAALVSMLVSILSIVSAGVIAIVFLTMTLLASLFFYTLLYSTHSQS